MGIAFTGDAVLDKAGIEAGELIESHLNNRDTHIQFEDGVKVGRFVKWEDEKLKNLDGVLAPKIVGVPMRMISGTIGNDTYDGIRAALDLVNYGYITVEVVEGLTPLKFGQVYAENAGVNSGADYGKATTVATDNILLEDVDFLHEVKDNVWIVRIKKIL